MKSTLSQTDKLTVPDQMKLHACFCCLCLVLFRLFLCCCRCFRLFAVSFRVLVDFNGYMHVQCVLSDAVFQRLDSTLNWLEAERRTRERGLAAMSKALNDMWNSLGVAESEEPRAREPFQQMLHGPTRLHASTLEKVC
jgi:hypothetical protein